MTFNLTPRLIRATVILAFALGGGMAATVAAAEAIQCPYAKVTRQITTPIPSGWWTTPVQQNLQETKIAVIGGKKTLVCNYGHAGSIMRLPPAGHDCQAIHTGFNCQAAYVAPQTYSTKRWKSLRPGLLIWIRAMWAATEPTSGFRLKPPATCGSRRAMGTG